MTMLASVGKLPEMSTKLSAGPDAVAEIEEFIYTMIRWGEHHYDQARVWSIDQMRIAIPEYPQVVEQVRQGGPVRYFENLSGATFQTIASSPADAGVSVRNPLSGEEVALDGPGMIEISSYVATFQTAVAAWNRAINLQSHAELLSAYRDGTASIEGFVNRKATEWNASNPQDRLDERSGYVGFLKKLTIWVPKMSGKPLDINEPFWPHFVEVKKYRDKVATHPRHSVLAVSLLDLAQRLNLFTSGIAVPLFNLHQLFNQAVPSLIIRAAYAPEVTVSTGPT